MQSIVLGAGCFWCVEAVFKRINGVGRIVVGYTGGKVDNPTYKQVCTGTTGHAEVGKIEFDPKVTSLEEILTWFWRAHDPTQLNRQGADVGTQYRSGIYWTSEEQRAAAEASKVKAQADHKAPIVTEIVPLGTFYPAENYHQDYYDHNPNQGYCSAVIGKKLKKLGFSAAPVGNK